MAGIRSRIHVRVVTTSGIDSGFGASAPHGAAILDLLAAAGTRPGTTLIDDLPIGSAHRPARADHDPVGQPRPTCRRPPGPAAATGSPWSSSNAPGTRPAASAWSAVPAHGRVVVVPAGGSFRSAWEGVPC